MPSNFDPSPLFAIVGAVVLIVGPYTKSVIDALHLAAEMPPWAPFAISLAVGGTLAGVILGAVGAPYAPMQMVAVVVFSALGSALSASGQRNLGASAAAARNARTVADDPQRRKYDPEGPVKSERGES